MTSMAFVLGVLPLVISTGAGSASQNAIGTGVAGGMISGTVLAIFLVPVFLWSCAESSKARPESTHRFRHKIARTGCPLRIVFLTLPPALLESIPITMNNTIRLNDGPGVRHLGSMDAR